MTISGFIMTSSPLFITLLTVLSLAVGLAGQGQSPLTKTYDFRVFLDDDDIGTQRFLVSTEGLRTRVEVEARFDVSFFYINVYSYRHTNLEIWKGDCLQQIQARTDDNGESFFVEGTAEDGQFQLHTHNGDSSVKGCVKTFAYWNPDLFQSDRLLNSQTGKLDTVEIQKLGKESISVHGALIPTEHQRIVSNAFTIDLWYTLDREWVALESTTKTGKKLRYQLK